MTSTGAPRTAGYWPFDGRFMREMLHPDPWPHLVHYVGGRVIYCSPDQFCTLVPDGPSDCVWIVPGTL